VRATAALSCVGGLCFFFFFAVLRFGLRVYYTLSHSTSIFFVKGVFEIGSYELFAWAGFEQRSSCSLPPEQLGL
jgi:hypothetical protein